MPDGNGKEARDLAEPSESVARSSFAGENNILNTINPLHGLGECVIETTLAANPLPTPQPPPTVPTFSLRICMCGRTLTGKSEQAIRLADRYGLKVRQLVEHGRWVVKLNPAPGHNIAPEITHNTFPRHNAQVLSAEELAQKAMDNAANAMAAGRKTLSREESLGQEASSALLQGGTISDKVRYRGRIFR